MQTSSPWHLLPLRRCARFGTKSRTKSCVGHCHHRSKIMFSLLHVAGKESKICCRSCLTHPTSTTTLVFLGDDRWHHYHHHHYKLKNKKKVYLGKLTLEEHGRTSWKLPNGERIWSRVIPPSSSLRNFAPSFSMPWTRSGCGSVSMWFLQNKEVQYNQMGVGKSPINTT